MSMEEIKKKEAVLVAKTIIGMPKYNVIGHETVNFKPITIHNNLSWEPPKGTTNILVIYLKDTS